ncbi:hypothetical protein EPIR_2617 [Erwinia piriflorinigrans CFBP 5888]|uniref:Uncharacterized protein n=1 Tax=Erwinia piriflorinigrans CFBP 5888 TaxID=1161919 RepID=V5Z9T8_9GAMM|nr:hypothetical protein EPIR_2617 [Erwinia piriflorinigrans CFBP 5888]
MPKNEKTRSPAGFSLCQPAVSRAANVQHDEILL